MPDSRTNFKGLVYGDIIGAPFSRSGTSNRYFDLGVSRNVFHNGRVRTFHPQSGEPSLASSAVLQWMRTERDGLTEEGLRRYLAAAYGRHPKADWSPSTVSSLSSPDGGRSGTPDWAPLVRISPVAMFDGSDLEHVLAAARTCVQATCRNEETILSALALVEAQWMALRGIPGAEIRKAMEERHGFDFGRPESDLSAQLQGMALEPIEMLGVPTGAYRYFTPKEPLEPSARLVAEAALRAVLASDGWEDAVRRAVALQGPSSAVGSIAGAFAEALYGQVTPTVEGRLVTIVPLDLKEQMDSLGQRPPRASKSLREERSDIIADRVDVIFMGVGSSSRTAYVVPEGRDDIMTALDIKFGGDRSAFTVIRPDEVRGYMDANTPKVQEGTRLLDPVPELGTLFLQKGRLVSETEYIGPGFPSIQERRRHRDAFRSLMAYSMKVQAELNRAAGYTGEGQVRYATAYHPIISRNRIEIRRGDYLEGAISINGHGLLRVEFGDLHEIGIDADASEYKNAEWCRRTVFSRADAVNPAGRVQQMKESISRFILDDGAGIDYEPDILNLNAAGDDIASSHDPRILSCPREPGVRPDADMKKVHGRENPWQEVSTIYTIGHSNQSADAFISKLQSNLIDTVISVRSNGRSRYCPQFDNDTLMATLDRHGISYYDAGDSLGGRQNAAEVLKRGGYVDLAEVERSPLFDAGGSLDWEAVRKTGSFREAMDRIDGMMKQGHIVALMCSEGDPLECHRLGMLARDFSERGVKVYNILRNGAVESMDETEMRMVETYAAKGLIPDMGAFEERKAAAYRAQNELHGWRPADLLRRQWKIRH